MERPPIPEEAVEYLEQKKLFTGYSYEDVWAEEHAVAFTVAKCMQMDVLGEIQGKLVDALKTGTGLKQFTHELEPYLKSKGWWGKKQMRDPKTGQISEVQLGSSKRLAMIWQVNMRSAYNAGIWEKAQASSSHPYLMWQVGLVKNKHRDEHLQWNGTVLPKDDPWWESHIPPCGYGCKCRIVPISNTRLARLKKEGVPNPVVSAKGTYVGGRRKIQLQRPKTTYKTYRNTRTGATRSVPAGVTPGFEWNQGSYGRTVPLALALMEKAEKVKGRDGVHTSMREYFSHPVMRAYYNSFVKVSLEKEKSEGKMMPLGLLANKYLAYAKKKGKKPASGMVAIEERQLIQKQRKHKLWGGGELSLEQWLMLPDVLQQPDRVYWDNKENNDTLLFTKAVEGGILFMPVRFGKMFVRTEVDIIASALIKPLAYAKMDKHSRYERLE